jgi:hypothetical protein
MVEKTSDCNSTLYVGQRLAEFLTKCRKPRAEIIAAPMIGGALRRPPARKDGQNKTGRGAIRDRFVEVLSERQTAGKKLSSS